MALKRRRIQKISTSERRKLDVNKLLPCKECGRDVDGLSVDVKSVICPFCVVKMVAPPPTPKKSTDEKRPRGWQFRSEYVAPDGTIYKRGEKVDESKNTTSNTEFKKSDLRKTSRTKRSNNDSRRSKNKTKSSTAKLTKRKPQTIRRKNNRTSI